MNMARYGEFEAERLLKRANEINPVATELAVKAMQALANDRIIPTHAMYLINKWLPGYSLTEKERNLLCPT